MMQEYNDNEVVEETVVREEEIVPQSSEKLLVEEMTLDDAKQPKKRGAGRPPKEGRYRLNVKRDTRIAVGGYRDILTLENTDPDYHYYWELDSSETGPTIHRRLLAGYSFVQDDEGVLVGQASVFKSEAVGSILRVPNGDGRYLYLLKIPMEWYEEDREAIEQRINETEDAIRGPQLEGGYSAGISIGRGR